MSRALAACGLVACLAAGCGRTTPDSASLTVTRGFGAATLIDTTAPRQAGTALALIARNARVTRSGDGSVAAVNGLPARSSWSYYINGLAQSRNPAATVLHAGDHVWWDDHDAPGARIRAVVGLFPEPFLDGTGGHRLPVRVECTEPSRAACAHVSAVLAGYGIPVARGGLLLSEYNDSYRVLVGRWRHVRSDPAAARLEQGPAVSGVFATPSANGSAVRLLSASGRPLRTLGPGGGLIAATDIPGQPPVWLVTGTDDAGVEAAAAAFGADNLHSRFALAIADGGGIPLPIAGRRPA